MWKCGQLTQIGHYIQIGGMWQPSFTTQQLEFFASLKTHVTILPNFSTDEQIYLLSGKVGPFKASLETPVPLWLALYLKSLQKCRILEPLWFQESKLMYLTQEETKNKQQLLNLQNDQFFQISYIFLSKAADDIKKVHQVRAFVEGLQNIRRQKIRKLFNGNKGALKLENLTTYEANRIREPLSKLELMVDRLKKTEGQRNRRQ